jgi:3-dehydroquinate dehydratase
MKKHNNRQRGYVNQSYGVTESEVVRQAKAYGKNYSSIDFAFNPDLTKEDFPVKNRTDIGSLIVGTHEFELTKAEAVKIIQTLDEAITSTQKRYRLGILN